MRWWQGQFSPMSAEKQEYWDNLLWYPKDPSLSPHLPPSRLQFAPNWVKSRRAEGRRYYEFLKQRIFLKWQNQSSKTFIDMGSQTLVRLSLVLDSHYIWGLTFRISSIFRILHLYNVSIYLYFLRKQSSTHFIFLHEFYPLQCKSVTVLCIQH